MKHLTLLLLIFLSINCDAQSTINANGNTSSVNGNTYSYSLGEMCVVHTGTSPNLVVTHGVLQPMNKNATSVMQQWLETDKIHVYPNPTSTTLQLELNTKEGAQANFYLLDIKGRYVLSRNEELLNGTNKFEFDLSQLANAYYVLQVQLSKSNKIYSQSFKIQKIK